ncbi:hypothetical protein B2J93_3305 [Marssonina coronariae]|uniref:Uncharacterized protein n=1 Tax=Diplocarpon coronariae TaxID=2795749 RepID=A0A218ZBS4_9HELO|nr:hypothetical protein B2J93_3305 [Marssonina coronariae]
MAFPTRRNTEQGLAPRCRRRAFTVDPNRLVAYPHSRSDTNPFYEKIWLQSLIMLSKNHSITYGSTQASGFLKITIGGME